MPRPVGRVDEDALRTGGLGRNGEPSELACVTVAIGGQDVGEVIKVELEVGHLGLAGQYCHLLHGCLLILFVRERVVGEILFEVAVRLGLHVALLDAPVNVIGRAVDSHPEAE